MTPKQGIIHDYDLWANQAASAKNQTCLVCGASPMSFQWSDYSGEAMCTKCGTPYQLQWGSETQKKEGKYPYLNLKEEWVPIVREYYNQTKKFTYLGVSIGATPGLREFDEWVKKHHPELAEE